LRELEGPAQREIIAMDFGRTNIAACATSVSAIGTQGVQISQRSAPAGGCDPSNSTVQMNPPSASRSHTEKLRTMNQMAQEVDEISDGRQMALRDQHLLRNSMTYRANNLPLQSRNK
jgi:hypothetical protein